MEPHYQNCLVSYPGHSLWGGSYPSAEKQSVYSTAPGDWATGHSLEQGGVSYPSAEKQSVYSTAPGDWATGHSLERGWGGLLLCRDAVGIFYSPQPADWANTE